MSNHKKYLTQKFSNSYRNLAINGPKSSPICTFSKNALENRFSVLASFQGPPQMMSFMMSLRSGTKSHFLNLQVRRWTISSLHLLNDQSPAGKQSFATTELQADYECHLQRWSPSEGNLSFISIKRSKEHWPRPGGPGWSLGIPVDL